MSDETWRTIKPPVGTARQATAHELRLIEAVTTAVRRERTEPMALKRSASAKAHIDKAAELYAIGLSATVVGIRMALDEGREDRPFSERQVRKWLAEAKKG